MVTNLCRVAKLPERLESIDVANDYRLIAWIAAIRCPVATLQRLTATPRRWLTDSGKFIAAGLRKRLAVRAVLHSQWHACARLISSRSFIRSFITLNEVTVFELRFSNYDHSRIAISPFSNGYLRLFFSYKLRFCRTNCATALSVTRIFIKLNIWMWFVRNGGQFYTSPKMLVEAKCQLSDHDSYTWSVVTPALSFIPFLFYQCLTHKLARARACTCMCYFILYCFRFSNPGWIWVKVNQSEILIGWK